MLDNNCNIKQIIDTFGWDENFKEELKKKLID